MKDFPAVVGELVAKWRAMDKRMHSAPGWLSECADELESTLSALTAEAGKGERDAFEAWITASPIEACVTRLGPQSSWPGHYRNYAVQLAWESWQAARLAMSTATPAGEWDIRMFDSQWVNVVNHANCYRDMDKEDAIAAAVKLTEQAMAANVRDGKWPLAASPRGASAGGE